MASLRISQLNKRLIKIKIFRTIYSVFVCTKFNSVISNSVVQIYYTQFTFARNVNIFGIFEKLFKQNCAFLFFLTQRKKISKVSLFMNNKMQLLQLTTFRKQNILYKKVEGKNKIKKRETAFQIAVNCHEKTRDKGRIKHNNGASVCPLVSL